MIFSTSLHLATGYDLWPVGLTYCEVTIGKLQFKHTFLLYYVYYIVYNIVCILYVYYIYYVYYIIILCHFWIHFCV